MDYFELMKGFLFSTVETFRKVRDTDPGDSLKYYLILLVINAVLTAIVILAMVNTIGMAAVSGVFKQAGLQLPGIAGVGVVFFALNLIIVQFVLVFIGAAWLHLFVYLLGGRKGYVQTLKAITFGSTPSMVFGWIPVIGLLAGIWSFVLEILGVRELQDMTTGKAALAGILAILAILLIIVAIAALFIPVYSEITPVPVTGF